MGTTADIRMWRSEGRAEGMAEGMALGMAEARRDDLLKLLRVKFVHLPPELAGCGPRVAGPGAARPLVRRRRLRDDARSLRGAGAGALTSHQRRRNTAGMPSFGRSVICGLMSSPAAPAPA